MQHHPLHWRHWLALATALALLLIAESAAATKASAVEYAGYQGYLATPNDDQQHPALILIHEWWGLNDNIRQFADRFAEQGYVALAVDLYGGKLAQNRDQARALAGGVRNDMPGAFGNLKAAVDWLQARDDVATGRLASIGWCFGGGWSYQMAKNDLGVKSSVIYYGFFNPDDDLSQMRTSLLGHFGEADRAIKVDNVRELQIKLKTASGDHEVYIYPNAGHAFANEGGANYDREAAELAWQRTLAFLKEHL